MSILPKYSKKGLKISPFLLKKLERVSGIEPPSRPWQGRIIATIPHPQRANLQGKFYVAETFNFQMKLLRFAL